MLWALGIAATMIIALLSAILGVIWKRLGAIESTKTELHGLQQRLSNLKPFEDLVTQHGAQIVQRIAEDMSSRRRR